MIRDTASQDRTVNKSTRRWLRARLVVPVGVVLVAGVIAWPVMSRVVASGGSVDRAGLRLAQVERGELVRDISVQGKVVAAVKPIVYSPAAGRVALKVRAGDAVHAGDLIAVIQNPDLVSRRAQEQSRLDSLASSVQREQIQTQMDKLALKEQLDLAQVELTAAERELRRATLAHQKNAISEQDYEKAQDELDRAKLEHGHRLEETTLKTQRLELELTIRKHDARRQALLVEDLDRQIAELSIPSPVTGVVGNLEVEEKDAVVEFQPLLSVVDLSALEVELDVPETYVEELVPGLAVELGHGNAEIAGRLASISPEIEGGRVKCRVRFSGEPGTELRQNQQMAGRILLERKADVLTVARGAFLQSGGGHIAYVVDDGVARRRAIRTGATSVSRIEVTSGLAEGETIVTSDTTQFAGEDQVLVID
ncbi:MAG: efflux RND transporter periplasmic adaptor subunit [Pseudomonadales bacterium]|nr:efflux RND transporter periplasmic adaptor subunit [Pseudomonadales bacterium]